MKKRDFFCEFQRNSSTVFFLLFEQKPVSFAYSSFYYYYYEIDPAFFGFYGKKRSPFSLLTSPNFPLKNRGLFRSKKRAA